MDSRSIPCARLLPVASPVTAPASHGWLVVTLAVSLLLPSAAWAQDGLGDQPLPPSPIEQLLEQRAALNLSPDQLSRLDEIKQRLASKNEPLVNQMMTLRQEWQRARRAARNGREGAPARVEQIR